MSTQNLNKGPVQNIKLVGWDASMIFTFYTGELPDGTQMYGVDFCDTAIDWFYEKPTNWREVKLY